MARDGLKFVFSDVLSSWPLSEIVHSDIFSGFFLRGMNEPLRVFLEYLLPVQAAPILGEKHQLPLGAESFLQD